MTNPNAESYRDAATDGTYFALTQPLEAVYADGTHTLPAGTQLVVIGRPHRGQVAVDVVIPGGSRVYTVSRMNLALYGEVRHGEPESTAHQVVLSRGEWRAAIEALEYAGVMQMSQAAKDLAARLRCDLRMED